MNKRRRLLSILTKPTSALNSTIFYANVRNNGVNCDLLFFYFIHAASSNLFYVLPMLIFFVHSRGTFVFHSNFYGRLHNKISLLWERRSLVCRQLCISFDLFIFAWNFAVDCIQKQNHVANFSLCTDSNNNNNHWKREKKAKRILWNEKCQRSIFSLLIPQSNDWVCSFLFRPKSVSPWSKEYSFRRFAVPQYQLADI